MKQLKARDILTRSGFKKTGPQTTISAVFSQLHSAHDAVFVFDGDKFLGLINLYYSLLKKRSPAKAKVTTCLYSPPKIDLSTTIPEIARLMVESRVYTLPVFENNGNFYGVITARSILRWALSMPEASKAVGEVFVLKNLVYIGLKEGVGKARNLMVDGKISRLLVLDKENRLVGVLSSFDLRTPFSSPTETIHFMSRTPIKKEIGDLPIERFVNRNLVSLEETESIRTLINNILEKDIGSILIFKKEKRLPLGLVSIRDLLRFVWERLGRERERQITGGFKLPLDQEYRKILITRLKQIIDRNQLLSRKVKDINLVLSSLAKKNIKKPLIKITARVKTDKNQLLNIKAHGRNIFLVFKKLTNRLKQRLERS